MSRSTSASSRRPRKDLLTNPSAGVPSASASADVQHHSDAAGKDIRAQSVEHVAAVDRRHVQVQRDQVIG
jgi:hypothetical protein